jgi:hypothetical protein
MARLDFTQPHLEYLYRGWHETDEAVRWSGKEATLRFRLEKIQPLNLRMMAITCGRQSVHVQLNGHDVGILESAGHSLGMLELLLPANFLQPTNLLTFMVPNAHPPQDAEHRNDDRILGIGVAWMEFIPPGVPVYQPGTRMSFTDNYHLLYLRDGWDRPTPDGQRFTEKAVLEFRLERPEPLRLRMLASTSGQQRIAVTLNDVDAGCLESDGGKRALMELPLPAEAIAETNTLTFLLPGPHPDGAGPEDRQLEGMTVAWLELQPPGMPIYQPGTRIDFTQSDLEYLASGWHRSENWCCWTTEEAVLRFRLTTVPERARLRMQATTWGKQQVIIKLNNSIIGTVTNDNGPLKTFGFVIPPRVLQEENTLTFLLPDASSSKSMGYDGDTRSRGLAVNWLELST